MVFQFVIRVVVLLQVTPKFVETYSESPVTAIASFIPSAEQAIVATLAPPDQVIVLIGLQVEPALVETQTYAPVVLYSPTAANLVPSTDEAMEFQT